MRKSTVFGVFILLFGIVYLLFTMGTISRELWVLLVNWQTLLIALGVVGLFDRDRGGKISGVLLITIGVIFLLPKIDPDLKGSIVVPLLIIMGGLWWIIASVCKKRKRKHYTDMKFDDNFKSRPFTNIPSSGDGYVKREYSFTGSKERWSDGKLKHLEIDAAFSGVELDLTQAELSDEVDTVHIKITSVFSGVTLFIPSDWNVVMNKTGVFGGWSDKRSNLEKVDRQAKLVVLELEAVFGGGEVKSYE